MVITAGSCHGQQAPAVVTPIDAVLAEFESQHPAVILPGSTSDARFARRAYLDLTGYPPGPEQLQQFVTSTDADKDRRLVRELLQSERYAWKWGRWLALKTGANELDLAYAAGEIRTRPQDLFLSWIQWMQTNLAADLPYHQIVERCLVSTSRDGRSLRDLESELNALSSADDLEGTAYLHRITNDLYWRRTPVVTDVASRGEDVAERFLGLTLKCARCHDHPTLPITQLEHQQFAAVFRPMVYTERPLTTSEKRRLIAGGVLFGVLICSACLWMTKKISPHNWLRRAIPSLVGVISSGVMFGVCNYLHLIPGIRLSSRTSPGLWVAQLIDHGLKSGGVAGTALFAVSLFVTALVLIVRGLRHFTSVGRYRVIQAFCVALLLLTAADYVYIRQQRALQASSASVESVIQWAQRSTLRWLGMGGYGQQPREIFVKEDPESDPVEPKFLKGAALNEVPQDPDRRQMLADWLRDPAVPFLSQHFINQVWQEYFSESLLPENEYHAWEIPSAQDAAIRSSRELRQQLLILLAADFRNHGWSIRTLHERIATSRLYRMAGDLEVSDSHANWPQWLSGFPARRLTAEQYLASIEQATGVSVPVGAGYAKPGDSPFQIASAYPWTADAGAVLMRAFANPHLDGSFTTEAAMTGLVEPSLRAHLMHAQGWLATELHEETPPEKIVRAAFNRCFGRDPDSAEQDAILKSKPAEMAWSEFAVDVFWAMMNSTEFQYVL